MEIKAMNIDQLKKIGHLNLINNINTRSDLCKKEFENWENKFKQMEHLFLSKIEFKTLIALNFAVNKLAETFTVLPSEENQGLIFVKDKLTDEFILGLAFCIYENDRTKIMLTEFSFITENNMSKLKQGKSNGYDVIIRMLEIFEDLEVDLLFPAYTKKDEQEGFLKTLGFEETNLKATKGQKVLQKKHTTKIVCL